MSASAPDYGIDAPGLAIAFLATGGVAAAATAALAANGWRWGAAAAGIVALYGVGMATLMVVWSKTIKRRDRDHVLDLLTWRGDEQVLDIGCGRGLMMIGAAQRLSREGSATGIDLWRARDQAANTPAATLENARRAGVADRVAVRTGDMRALPFPDASMDVILSHWAVHNVEPAADRDTVLAEMARVLRPGGVIALADIAHGDAYAARLAQLGLRDQRRIAPVWRNALLGAISFGGFRPGWIIARRGWPAGTARPPPRGTAPARPTPPPPHAPCRPAPGARRGW